MEKPLDVDNSFEASGIEQAEKSAIYKGCFISISSWVNFEEIDDVDENCSLALRAKLLYGKHLFEDLLSNNSFGSEEQIIQTLELCNAQGVLVINKESSTLSSNQTSSSNIQKKRLYSKLLSWLS